MAKTTRKAGKRATTAGRGGLRARKSGVAKTHNAQLRKPGPAKSVVHKQKPSFSPESARLKRQLKAARMQQEASAEILRAVANAAGDAAGPLQLIAETTALLFRASSVAIQLAEGSEFTQEYRVGAIAKRVGAAYPRSNIKVGGRNLPGTVVFENRQIHIPDLDHLDPSMFDFPGLPHARAGGARTVCGTPLRREDKAIGALIALRDRLLPFTDDELALLQSFADQAVIAIENARLFNETRQALERQAATSDILRIISQSPTDVQPVFDAIVLTAVRLFKRDRSFILHCDSATYWPVALAGPDGLLPFPDLAPEPIDRDANFPSRAIVTGENLHLPDWSAIDLPEYERRIRDTFGFNSALYLPLLHGGKCIGILGIAGTRAGMFDDDEIALAESFRDQALIAIENTRLFDEVQARTRDLSEALQQQIATADVLRIISRSVAHAAPVFDTILESCQRLFNPYDAAVYLVEGDRVRGVARRGAGAGEWGADSMPLEGSSTGVAIAQRRPVHFPDLADKADLPEDKRALVKEIGGMTVLYAPMISQDSGVGSLVVTRRPAKPFTEVEIGLIQTFADQAVIAIENARLFEEVQAKTADLTESLQQQTATADVLKIISRSAFDLQAVFDTLTSSAVDLLGVHSGTICVRDGELFRYRSAAGAYWTEELWRYLQEHPVTPGRNTAAGRVILSGCIEQIPDIFDDPDYAIPMQALTPGHTPRAILSVPLLGKDRVEGAMVLSRQEPGPFTQREVDILQTFADQASIAIENTRLFNETQQALEQQTATAEILSVMSSSPTDVTPVFEAIAERARELSGSRIGSAVRFDGELLHMVAFRGSSPEAEAAMHAAFPMKPGNGSLNARVIAGLVPLQIPDIDLDPAYQLGDVAKKGDYRALLAVPMIHDGRAIGAIGIGRDEPGLFPEKIVTLLQTFASQAVIAIENVRLFNETREALERQTATSEVLAVISRSPSDLKPVLQAISDTAARLCGSEQTMFFRYDGNVFRILASWNFPPEVHEMLESRPLMPGHPSAIGRAGASLKPVCIPDVLADPDYGLTGEQSRARYRATLAVPLLREGRLIGALSLNRSEPGAFTEKQIELVATFADQAVIAIENVRLFDEVEAKTSDLEESLQQQIATADVLKVISRSAFDLNSVMNTLTRSAAELCKAELSALYLRDGDLMIARGMAGVDGTRMDFLRNTPLRIDDSGAGRALQAGSILNMADVQRDGTETTKKFGEALGFNSILFVPLMREGCGIGVFALGRKRTGEYSQREVELLQTFADQAVIAIENTRLFNETKQALAYQTGSSNVLRVIASSPTDVEPVLKEIVESARELCEANDAVVLLRDAEHLRFSAHSGPIPVTLDKWPISRNWTAGRAFVDQKPVHVHDMLSGEGAEFPDARAMGQSTGSTIHTVLSVPLLRGNESIGAILLRRTEVRPFNDKQINLLSTFADQAVIAIQNARLFNETKEALERQTATAEILKVIASSPDDVQPVFQAIAERSNHLVGGFATIVVSIIDDVVHLSAFTPTTPAADAALRAFYPRPLSGFTYSDAVRRGEIHRIVDAEVELAGEFDQLTIVRQRGWRSALWVPLLLEGEAIGVIGVTRVEPGPFADHHVEMLKTFADQAVIAISNVKLFRQVQERTRELSQSLDDLRTAQDRLVQTEKLASLGQLTAGIAHEIKNPLNFVNNFSTLSVELVDEMTDVFENPALDEGGRRRELDEIRELLKSNLAKVVQHGKRADSIVKNMLLHSREGSGEQRAVDINALLDESLNLAYHGARAEKASFNITMQRDLDPDAGVIELFPQEITRVLLNLISNGFYAATRRAAESDDGFEPTLRAATKNLGNRIEIRIRDNGTGIAPEVKEKIFNPFFTTKPAGEGTGLGLSMSHDIVVKQHGGTIHVDSEPGIFTEFIINLPRATVTQKAAGGTN